MWKTGNCCLIDNGSHRRLEHWGNSNVVNKLDCTAAAEVRVVDRSQGFDESWAMAKQTVQQGAMSSRFPGAAAVLVDAPVLRETPDRSRSMETIGSARAWSLL